MLLENINLIWNIAKLSNEEIIIAKEIINNKPILAQKIFKNIELAKMYYNDFSYRKEGDNYFIFLKSLIFMKENWALNFNDFSKLDSGRIEWATSIELLKLEIKNQSLKSI